MKNAWQPQSPMESNYQQHMYTELTRIKALQIGHKAKIKMIAGLVCLLREKQQMEKVKAQENISTSFSEEQSNFTVYEHEIEDLEDRILQKRAIKFQINQEIQGVEEDLFQMEKTVDTKKDFDEFLRRQIDSKMKNIERSRQKHKSFKAVTGIFKGWLY